MMKKYFKNPLEAKKSDATSVMKVLKKVFPKGIEGASFFYKAEFEYENGECAPFLYIGSIDANWKKYIKTSKKDKDFVTGVCKLETGGENSQVQKLLLKAEVGKGSKAPFLKAINKQLLKKLSVKAEFVEELMVKHQEEEGNLENTPSMLSPQELFAEFKSISEELQLIQVEHNEKQIDTLLDKIEDWEDAYRGLPVEEKKKLAHERVGARKVADYLQKVNQIDSKIDLLFEKIEVLIVSYLEMNDSTSRAALVISKKLEKAIEKIETLAKKINDNDFIEACQEFRQILVA